LLPQLLPKEEPTKSESEKDTGSEKEFGRV
jgi:hypothetical protein